MAQSTNLSVVTKQEETSKEKQAFAAANSFQQSSFQALWRSTFRSSWTLRPSASFPWGKPLHYMLLGFIWSIPVTELLLLVLTQSPTTESCHGACQVQIGRRPCGSDAGCAPRRQCPRASGSAQQVPQLGEGEILLPLCWMGALQREFCHCNGPSSLTPYHGLYHCSVCIGWLSIHSQVLRLARRQWKP